MIIALIAPIVVIAAVVIIALIATILVTAAILYSPVRSSAAAVERLALLLAP